MPIYAYACDSCSKEVDKLQKISDPVLTKCPHCGKHSLKRMLTAPNFRLSGSGWYETDFKNKDDKQKNLSDYKTGNEKKDSSAEAAKKSSDNKAEKKETSAQPENSNKAQASKSSKTESTNKTSKPTTEKQ